MDPDLILVFGFILVILMLVLPFAYIVNQRVQAHEERKLELSAAPKKRRQTRRGLPMVIIQRWKNGFAFSSASLLTAIMCSLSRSTN